MIYIQKKIPGGTPPWKLIDLISSLLDKKKEFRGAIASLAVLLKRRIKMFKE